MSKTSHVGKTHALIQVKETRKAAKLQNKNLFFQIGTQPHDINESFSFNLLIFCFLLSYQVPTYRVAPFFCLWTTHNLQFLDSVRRRANAGKASFLITSRWPIHIINPVDETKLSFNTPHRRNTTHYIIVSFSLSFVVKTDYIPSEFCEPRAWT